MTDSVTSGVSSQQQKASRVTVGIIFGGRDQPNIIQHVITSIRLRYISTADFASVSALAIVAHG